MTNNPARLPGCSVLPPLAPRSASPATTPRDKRKTLRPTGERFATINAFVDCSLAKLNRSELATWLVLWRDTKNGTARTSAGDIARRIGTTRRAVTAAIGKLRKRGLLVLLHRGGLNRGVSVHRVVPLLDSG